MCWTKKYVPVNLLDSSDESADGSIHFMAYGTTAVVLSNSFHYPRKTELGDVVPLWHKTD